MSETPLLSMEGITVDFGHVRVLDGAHLRVDTGEIHALLGENGAGKSSLMKVLFGLYSRSEGRILIRGQETLMASPQKALAAGVAMIHQELPFAMHLSVAENIFLGREYRHGPFGFIDDDRLVRESMALLSRFPVQVDPRTLMGRLSIAQQQIVAIAKALSTGADLIVLDEATTALTETETQLLFEVLQDLKRKGKTFIMITHKLDEVFQICDRVTVMRDGKTITTVNTADVTPLELVRHMVGRDVADLFPPRHTHRDPAETQPLLRVKGLTTRKLNDVSFEVYRGEVLGVGGLMGAGRTELFDALFGTDPVRSGTIELKGELVRPESPASAISQGIAYITESRKHNGLALQLGTEENITLPLLSRHCRVGLIHDAPLKALSESYINKLRITARARTPVGVLSGGNQQKVVLAKWLATGADLFLLDEPTRGIDVGTKQEVYALINELTAAGKAVIMVSSELPELMALSDRFVVLSEGRLVRSLGRDEATPEAIVYHASSKPNASNTAV